MTTTVNATLEAVLAAARNAHTVQGKATATFNRAEWTAVQAMAQAMADGMTASDLAEALQTAATQGAARSDYKIKTLSDLVAYVPIVATLAGSTDANDHDAWKLVKRARNAAVQAGESRETLTTKATEASTVAEWLESLGTKPAETAQAAIERAAKIVSDAQGKLLGTEDLTALVNVLTETAKLLEAMQQESATLAATAA